MNPLPIAMIGAEGRMGEAILRLASADPVFIVTAKANSRDSIAEAVRGADVVIDFSHRSTALALTSAVVERERPLIIGTTGHLPEERQAIAAAAARVPVVLAPNFSIGVNLLFYLTRKAAEILGPEFDQEIIEVHHRLKKDAPSGTARRLAEVLCEVRGKDYHARVLHGREGEPGARTADEIAIHAVRGGDVIGDHTVLFAGGGERVELTHKASTRDTFAAGALRAALWIRGRAPGLYSMEDVLGLK